MKRYTIDEVKKFLQAIDRNLTEPARIEIIGGTAAALGYGFKGATQDIDTANSITKLEAAIKKAKAETGFNILVEPNGVFDPPNDYEDRWVELIELNLKLLSVHVPEAIDLILMKTMRCEAHDLSAIDAIIKGKALTADAITDRYLTEMRQTTKNKRDRQFNFIAMIEHCFGPDTKNMVEARVVAFESKR